MGALEQIIQNEVDKKLAKSTLISTAPYRVIAILDNELYTVKSVTNNSQFNLYNYSGSSLEVGETVQVYYRGESITSHNAYIGASLTKPNNIAYINGEDEPNVSLNEKVMVSEIKFDSKKETIVNVVFNSVVGSNESGDYTFEIYVDGNKQEFDFTGTVGENTFSPCSFVIPIELSEIGSHIVQIYGEGVGSLAQIKSYVFGQNIFEYVPPSEPTDEDDYIYYLTSNHSETIRYIGSYENIIMPTTLEGKPLTIVGMTTFNYGDVQGVIIPEGITKIE